MKDAHEEQVLLLVSGGLDSTVLAYAYAAARAEVLPVFIDYGQHAAATELQTARQVLPPALAEQIHVLNLRDPFVGSPSLLIKETDPWSRLLSAAELHLPYRNLFLLTAACAFAATRGLKKVAAAFINSNNANEIDASLSFLTSLNGLMGANGGVQVEFPLRYKSKTEVAKMGLELKAPIALTFSCQINSVRHCGACPNCVDRLNALRDAEVP